MNPNENQQPLPSDYLNQIAPKPPKRLDFFRQKPIFIGALCLGVIIFIIILGIISSSLSNNIGSTERLAARLMSTKSTATLATSNIKSTKLRALNSSLGIYLTNTIRDATPILAKNNIKINKLSKKVTLAESNETILATLEDARLNAIYDRIYAGEMAHQLDTTLILMRQIFTDTRSATLKSFLDNAYKTLEPTQKDFAEFNAANG